MKRILLLVLFFAMLLSGCSSPAEEASPNVQLANPWTDYASLSEAEAAAGFSLSIPETTADGYTAEVFRCMNGQLLEVTYRYEEFEVTVRKMAGEGQDISGDYRAYDTEQVTESEDSTITNKQLGESCLTLISYDGYSYSLYAPKGYWGDSQSGFLMPIFGE